MKALVETSGDQFLCDVVRRMVGAHRSADYFLMQHRSLKNHAEFAVEAQSSYRIADKRLQKLGVVDNAARQSCIHGIALALTS